MLSQLDSLRAVALARMTTPCTLVRSGRANIVLDGDPGCLYVATNKTLRLPGFTPGEAIPVYQFSLPVGTDLFVGDTIIADGRPFTVSLILEPQTGLVDVATVCTAYNLYTLGAGGAIDTSNPLYLRLNCTVTLKSRDETVTIATGVRCHLGSDTGAMQYTDQGGIVLYPLLFPVGSPVANNCRAYVTALDGFASLTGIPITHYRLADVTPVPGPMPYLRAMGEGVYGAVAGG